MPGGKLRAKTKFLSGHERREPRRGVNQFHAVLFQFVGNRAKNRVGIFLLEPEQERHRPQIGPEVVKVFRRNLAGHDALRDTAVGEGGERGVGLVFKRDSDELFHAGGARLPGEFQRERAVAGDEAERCGRGVHGKGRMKNEE